MEQLDENSLAWICVQMPERDGPGFAFEPFTPRNALQQKLPL